MELMETQTSAGCFGCSRLLLHQHISLHQRSGEKQQALKDSVPFSGMQLEEICRGEPEQEILQPA